MNGVFISLEGNEGAGKSTAGPFLRDLIAPHAEVVLVREPGGTPFGEKIRNLVLNDHCSIRTEVMLFFASRNELIHATIKPALARGAVVVCDRFIDTSYAYQGYGRQALDDVKAMDRFVLRGFEPTHTLFFDISQETSRKRMEARGLALDRFEKEELAFFDRVRKGFDHRFRTNQHRMHRIDANHPLEHVQQQLRDWVDAHLICDLLL